MSHFDNLREFENRHRELERKCVEEREVLNYLDVLDDPKDTTKDEDVKLTDYERKIVNDFNKTIAQLVVDVQVISSIRSSWITNDHSIEGLKNFCGAIVTDSTNQTYVDCSRRILETLCDLELA